MTKTERLDALRSLQINLSYLYLSKRISQWDYWSVHCKSLKHTYPGRPVLYISRPELHPISLIKPMSKIDPPRLFITPRSLPIKTPPLFITLHRILPVTSRTCSSILILWIPFVLSRCVYVTSARTYKLIFLNFYKNKTNLFHY